MVDVGDGGGDAVALVEIIGLLVEAEEAGHVERLDGGGGAYQLLIALLDTVDEVFQ